MILETALTKLRDWGGSPGEERRLTERSNQAVGFAAPQSDAPNTFCRLRIIVIAIQSGIRAEARVCIGC